jgi:hypothetical protein
VALPPEAIPDRFPVSSALRVLLLFSLNTLPTIVPTKAPQILSLIDVIDCLDKVVGRPFVICSCCVLNVSQTPVRLGTTRRRNYVDTDDSNRETNEDNVRCAEPTS